MYVSSIEFLVSLSTASSLPTVFGVAMPNMKTLFDIHSTGGGCCEGRYCFLTGTSWFPLPY